MTNIANVTLSDLLSLWRVQTSLLQAYRGIFISAQSILVSVAAAIAYAVPDDTQAFLALVSLFFVAIYLIYVWRKTCLHRSRAVSFVQWLILKYEQGTVVSTPLLTMKKYMESGKYQEIDVANDIDYIKWIEGPTTEFSVRKHIERLPWIFLAVWVFIIVSRTIIAFV